MPRALILLATYNGERFLQQLTESLARQSESDWCALVSDDHSTDSTPSMLSSWAAEEDRVHLLPRLESNRGAKLNFGRLLSEAEAYHAELIFFCDQDDIWHPDKIEKMLAVSASGEGAGPLMVLSGCNLIDERGALVGGSAAISGSIYSAGQISIGDACSRNAVPGCVMAFNKELLGIASPLPECAIMHDWWCFLVVKLTGALVTIEEPLIEYRQHEANVFGAPGARRALSLIKANGLMQMPAFKALFRQAAAAVRQTADTAEAARLSDAKAFAELLRESPMRRIAGALQLCVRKGRPLMLFLFLLRLGFARSGKCSDAL